MTELAFLREVRRGLKLILNAVEKRIKALEDGK